MAKFDKYLIEDIELSYLIWIVIRLWQRGSQRELKEFNLTNSQFETLSAIYHLAISNQEFTQIELSAEVNIDPMTISTILRNLEKKGLVKRKESLIDTRARVVSITQEGKDLFELALCKIKKIKESHLKNLDQIVLRKELICLIDELNKNNSKYEL